MSALLAQRIPSFQIEPYREEFRDAVATLITTIQQKEFSIPITLSDQPDLNNVPAAYQQQRGNFWVALDRGSVVGTIALIDVGNNIGVIRKMFVQMDQRGSGVAQQLFDTLLEWSTAHGFRALYLGTIDKLKAAQRFYEKNGFTKIETDRLPPQVARIRMPVDNLHYCLEL